MPCGGATSRVLGCHPLLQAQVARERTPVPSVRRQWGATKEARWRFLCTQGWTARRRSAQTKALGLSPPRHFRRPFEADTTTVTKTTGQLWVRGSTSHSMTEPVRMCQLLRPRPQLLEYPARPPDLVQYRAWPALNPPLPHGHPGLRAWVAAVQTRITRTLCPKARRHRRSSVAPRDQLHRLLVLQWRPIPTPHLQAQLWRSLVARHSHPRHLLACLRHSGDLPWMRRMTTTRTMSTEWLPHPGPAQPGPCPLVPCLLHIMCAHGHKQRLSRTRLCSYVVVAAERVRSARRQTTRRAGRRHCI